MLEAFAHDTNVAGPMGLKADRESFERVGFGPIIGQVFNRFSHRLKHVGDRFGAGSGSWRSHDREMVRLPTSATANGFPSQISVRIACPRPSRPAVTLNGRTYSLANW